jgi:hypothetical protein
LAENKKSGGPLAVELTKEIMEMAFDSIGRHAAARGIVIDIAVFGGSCLILASDIRGASGDVDAVFLSGGPAAHEISARVAREMGLSDDWLNEGVKRYAYPPGNPGPNILPFGDYPRDGASAVGLRVFLPMPQYMLAMKMLANRYEDDIDKIKSDISDAVGLMKVAQITTKESLVALLIECYPGIPGLVDPLAPRMKARIDTLVDAYANAIEEPDPTWNAGTGPATRKI